MSFAGIVNEVEDNTIVVERTLKDKTEIIELALDKKVKVSHTKKEDRNIATKVYLIVPKRIVKKVSPVKEVNDTHIDEARSINWVVGEQEMEL